MLLHHVAALVGCYYIMFYEAAWMIAMILSTELSSPFVNVRSILGAVLGKKHPIYMLNGFLILLTFFAFRILHGGVFYWYALYLSFDQLKALAPLPRATLYLVSLFFTVLNLVWFVKVYNGFAKGLANYYSLQNKKVKAE